MTKKQHSKQQVMGKMTCNFKQGQRNIYCGLIPYFAGLFSVLLDAVLACEFRTEKDQSPRIEWKKKGKGVTFVYFNGKFTGE